MGRKLLLRESTLRRMVGLLTESKPGWSTAEFAVLAPGAKEFIKVSREVFQYSDLQGSNRAALETLRLTRREIERKFEQLLELNSPPEINGKELKRYIGTSQPLSLAIEHDRDFLIDVAVSNVGPKVFGMSPEEFSAQLSGIARKMEPQLTMAFQEQTNILREFLRKAKGVTAVRDVQLVRFTDALNKNIIEVIRRNSLAGSMLDLAMHGDPLPEEIPRSLRDRIATVASRSKEYPGLTPNEIDEFTRFRFITFYKDMTRTMADAVLPKLTDGLIRELEDFPRIARELNDVMAADPSEIERWAKAPEGAPLGRIAFSPERMKREKIPYEANTELEDELKNDVWMYVHMNDDFEAENVSLIRNLVAQGYYDDTIRFTDPSVGTLYRGMAIQTDYVDKLGPGLAMKLKDMRMGEIRTIDVNTIYKPVHKSQLSSWTDDANIASTFAVDWSENKIDEKDAFIVVLHAQASDNPEGFLDALHLFRKLDVRNQALLNEREHFGLGDIRVSRATVARGGSTNVLLHDFHERMAPAVISAASSPSMYLPSGARIKDDETGPRTPPPAEKAKANKPGGTRYWGVGGAGMVFVCPEDGTVFLQKRSSSISSGGGKWAFPGGGIHPDPDEEGYWYTPIPEEYVLDDDDVRFVDTAELEVEEECGSMPVPFRILDEHLYEDNGFKYKTFVVSISLKVKNRWKPEPTEESAWESEGMGWFDVSEFRDLESSGKLFERAFTPKLKGQILKAMAG